MLAPVRTEAPAEPVVSLEEMKQHLRVDFSDDDGVIDALIGAAVGHLDGWSGILGRALVTQTWRQAFPRFSSCNVMRLPLAPVKEVVTVSYQDGDDEYQLLPDTAWQVLTDELGSYLTLRPGQSWPYTYDRPDAVGVTFRAGYGAPDEVPNGIRVAIMTHVKMHYDPTVRDTLMPMFDALVHPFLPMHL